MPQFDCHLKRKIKDEKEQAKATYSPKSKNYFELLSQYRNQCHVPGFQRVSYTSTDSQAVKCTHKIDS